MWVKSYFPNAYWPGEYWPDSGEDIVVAVEDIIGGILKGKQPPKNLTHLIKWIKKETPIDKSLPEKEKQRIRDLREEVLKEQIKKAELIKKAFDLQNIDDEEALLYIIIAIGE